MESRTFRLDLGVSWAKAGAQQAIDSSMARQIRLQLIFMASVLIDGNSEFILSL